MHEKASVWKLAMPPQIGFRERTSRNKKHHRKDGGDIMIGSEVLAITYGLGSAATWGAGDFSGGLATKRGNAFTVIFFSQIVGVAMLISLAAMFGEKLPGFEDLFMGGLAGIAGLLGLVALYRGLSKGRMSIVAPVSAVVTAIIPVVFASFAEELPEPAQLMGFVVAVAAMWVLSSSDKTMKIEIRELRLPIVAGTGFGLFFILIDSAGGEAVYWPLIAARVASISFVTAMMLVRGRIEMPSKSQLPFIAVTGIFDVLGNVFFVLAAQSGRLDISAVLASLYPAATVLLAWLILKERLMRHQWFGVAAAFFALVLIAS